MLVHRIFFWKLFKSLRFFCNVSVVVFICCYCFLLVASVAAVFVEFSVRVCMCLCSSFFFSSRYCMCIIATTYLMYAFSSAWTTTSNIHHQNVHGNDGVQFRFPPFHAHTTHSTAVFLMHNKIELFSYEKVALAFLLRLPLLAWLPLLLQRFFLHICMPFLNPFNLLL